MSGLDTRILRLSLRVTRRRLLGWTIAITTVLIGTAAGVIGLYPTAADRAVYESTVGRSTATAALNGRGYDLDQIGGIAAYEFGFFAVLALPIIAGHLAIHLTRTQEDRGLLELITAAPVDRLQPLRAAVATLGGTIALIWLVAAVGLTAVGLPASGSTRYATGLALLMATFAGVGFLAAQVATNGRTAHGVLLGVVATTYVTRAVIDGRDLPLTWLTPSGWLAELRPFGPTAWWAVAAPAVSAVVLTGLAARVAARRDLGAGLLAARSGPTTAPSWIRSVAALNHRLSRMALMGWAIGAAAWGAAIGLLAPEMQTIIEENPTMVEALGGGGQVTDLLAAMGLLVTALLATGALLQWVTVLAGEESSGRLGIMIASPLSRGRWWRQSLAVAVTQTAAVLAVGAAAQIMGTGLSGGGWSPSLLVDAAAYLPAVLAIGLVAAAAQAVTAGGAAVGWPILGWVAVVALLGETLGLPGWLRRTSPFELIGRIPVEPASATAVSGLAIAALALAVAGQRAITVRDLAA